MTKRIIALFLALILTVGLLPTVALAAEEDAGTTPSAAATTLQPEDEYYTFNGEHVGKAENANIKLSKTAVDNGNGTYTVTLEATANTQVKPKPTEVVFVLDASGSMNYCTENNPTGWGHFHENGKKCSVVRNDSSKSRWSIATNAIKTMVGNLKEKLGDSATFKYVYFQGGTEKETTAAECDENFQVTGRNGKKTNVDPKQGTPLVAGVKKGIDLFSSDPDTVKALIIVSDGEANVGRENGSYYPKTSATNFKTKGTIYTVGFMFKNDDFDSLASENCKFSANSANELTTAMGTIESKIIGMIDDPLGAKVDLVAGSLKLMKDTGSTQPDPTTKDDGRTITWTDKNGMTHVKLQYTVKLNDVVTGTAGVRVIDLNGNATFNYSYKQGNTTVSKSLSFPKPKATVYVAALDVKYKLESETGAEVNVTATSEISGTSREIKQLPYTFEAKLPTEGDTVTANGKAYYVKSVTGPKDKTNTQLEATKDNADAYTITVVLTETPPTATVTITKAFDGLPTDKQPTPTITVKKDGTVIKSEQTKNLTVDDLEPGTYTVEETIDAVTGYDLVTRTLDSNNELSFTVAAGETKTLTLTNHYSVHTHSIIYEYTGTVPVNAPELPETVSNVAFGAEQLPVAAVPTLAGYTFDGWKTDDVTVTDNKFTMPDSDVTFTGSWTQATANVDLNGYIKKSLVVAEGSNLPDSYNETFTFTVFVDNKEDNKFVTGSVTMNEAGTENVTFNGSIPLTVGLHTFTVKEDEPKTNKTFGMTYDTAEKTFALNVTENGCTFGHMNDNGKFVPASDGEDTFVTITNTYTQPRNSINLGELIKKNFSLKAGSESLPEDASYIFDVRVYEKVAETVSDAPYIGTVTMSDVGTAYFDFSKTKDKGELTFTEPGTHEYIVEEIKGDAAGVVDYDPNRYILEITVKDDLTIEARGHAESEAATLSVENAPELDPINTAVVTIENTYYKKPAPGTIDFSDIISKHLTKKGDKAFTGAEFTANVTGWKYDEAPQGEPQALALFTNEGPEFTFTSMSSLTLTATFPADTTVFDSDNVACGSFAGTLTVEEGQYLFLVEENNDGKSNITYDENKYWIKVYVDISEGKTYLGISVKDYVEGDSKETVLLARDWTEITPYITPVIFSNTIDTGRDDYIPIIIPTIVGKDTGMLNKTDHFAYVIGYPDGTVHPNGQITRAEVATIFFRLLKDEVRDGAFTTSNSYSDVAYGKWYNNPISTMSALGIITGYPDGTFKPDKPITRAEFAAIAARFDETQYGKSATFSDVIGHWAANEIGIAYANEWIKGYPDGTFKPDQNITRAEAMTMINRVLERKPESPSDLLTDMNKWTDNMDTSKWYYLDVQEATNSHAYTRKTFNYELWRQMLTDPDWSRYER